MKTVTKLVMMILMTVALLGTSNSAFAQEPPSSQIKGVRGEVTAVGSSSLTIAAFNGDTVTVNVTADTRIRRVKDRAEGSLSDIDVGNFAWARGQRNDDGSLNARLIAILPTTPRDMDKARGKVTAIEDNIIVVENNEGTQRIITDDKTRFRIGLKPARLEDINVDDPLLAIGETQSDGSLQALLVNVVTREQLRRHTLRGEVLSVDTDAGTVVVQGNGPQENIWTVETTEDTRYRLRGMDNPTLADIEVGDHVGIVGRKSNEAPDDARVGVARLIIVIPDEFKDSIRLLGEVTAVGDVSLTLNTRRGEFTILTDADTRYRTPGDQDVSFDGITVGAKAVVVGEPVDGQENLVQAKVVGIQINTDK